MYGIFPVLIKFRCIFSVLFFKNSFSYMHFLMCVYIEKIQINQLIKEVMYKSMLFCLVVLRSGDEARPCLALLF